jgi:hypothetical protein
MLRKPGLLIIALLLSGATATAQRSVAAQPTYVKMTGTPASAAQTTSITALSQHLKLNPDDNIYLTIRAFLKKDELDGMVSALGEKGVKVKLSNITYNPEKLLTRIRMEVEIGNCQAREGNCYQQTVEAYNGGEPLSNDKPLLFYLVRQVDRVGVSYGYPGDLPQEEIKVLSKMTGTLIGAYLHK